MLIEDEMDNRCDAVFVVVLDKIGNDKQSKDIGNNSRRLTNRQSFLKWIIRKTRQSKLCKTETMRKFLYGFIATQSNFTYTCTMYINTFFVFVFVFVIVFVNMCQGPVNIINFPKYFKGIGFWC